MLDSFKVINLINFFYKLKLSETMHIHDVFHFELFCSVVNDSLFNQKNESSESIIINNKDE